MVRVPNTDNPAYANYSGLIVTNPSANPTNETDPQAIWDMYTVPAPAPVLEAVQHPHLEGKK